MTSFQKLTKRRRFVILLLRGNYVNKCVKTKTVARIRPWKRSEVVSTSTEKTEEDVTDQVRGNPAMLTRTEETTRDSETQLCRLM
ncbi:unnamed protein product [Microthlaspi erraticum]|uniref:Uncharacterized protein n=1 Tax=Microthlaspi erraticum TaxID=1685480 RepID=A0A6D2IFW4_9BRAS|nr:unnamed protein product [Microthlaspi erraticum]